MDSNLALLRALASEQRAREASDPAIKKEWEALAIEWHQLATVIVKATKSDSVIHFQPFGSNNAS
jgi:hypothetical protein